MAKYTIMMSCGHEDIVELFGKNSEREKRIRYYESYGLCKECYKNKMKAQTVEYDLNFNASVLPAIDDEDGDILLSVWFSGDTKPYKEEIKKLGGYTWGDRQAANDWYSSNVPKCWNKVIKWRELQNEIIKAVSIGASNTITDKGLFAMAHYQIALNMQNKWKDKKGKIASIKKPETPEIIKGHKWNQKIYGKAGNYTVYPDGEKVLISDEEAEKLKVYIIEKEEYKKKIKEFY